MFDAKEYQRKYRERNKEKLAEYQRKYQKHKRQEIRDAKYYKELESEIAAVGEGPAEEIPLSLDLQQRAILRNNANALAKALKTREYKKKLVDFKGGECQHCGGIFHPVCYDFHHADPNEKDFTISSAMNRPLWKILSELNKCILLCSNCHRKHHALEQEKKWLAEQNEE